MLGRVFVSRVLATSQTNLRSRRFLATEAAPATGNTQQGVIRLKAKRQRAKKDPSAPPKPRVYKTDNPAVVKEFFEQLAKDMKIQPGDYNQWYSVRSTDLTRRPLGSVILRRNFGGSLAAALRSVFPEHSWEEHRFEHPPKKRFYSNLENQRSYFDWLAQKLNVKSPLDWHKVNWESVSGRKDLGAGFNQIVGLLNQGSVGKALAKIYPEAGFVAASFPKLANLVALNVSLNVAEVKSYIEHLAKELRISKPEDWYCVTLKHMRTVPNYKSIPNRLGGLPTMLSRVYPDHAWDMTKFSFGVYRTQQMGTLKPYSKPVIQTQKSKADKEFEKEQERERLSVQDADS